MLSSRKLNKLGLVAGAALSASLLSVALTPQKAAAVAVITFTETGGNVELTLNGSLNVTGLTPFFDGIDGFGGLIFPSQGLVLTNLPSFTLVDIYDGALTNPNNLVFGTGSDAAPTTASGSFFIVDPSNFLGLGSSVWLPTGYAGGILNSTASYTGDFATLGLTPGTYTSGFNSGANADSITINVGVTPVPEPLTMLGASAAIAFGAAFKRRKAQ